jgi:hypothetical protein
MKRRPKKANRELPSKAPIDADDFRRLLNRVL